MNRTFAYVILAAALGSWIGAIEQLLHITVYMFWSRYGGTTNHLADVLEALPIAGAFAGAALVLLAGVRRAAVIGAVGLLAAPLLGCLSLSHLTAICATALAYRIFDVAIIALAASVAGKHEDDRVAALALASFLLLRHAAAEVGVALWSFLVPGLAKLENFQATDALCILAGGGVIGLVVAVLRRTAPLAEGALPADAPYRRAAPPPRVDDASPKGGLWAALPFALAALIFACLATLFGARFSKRLEPELGLWVLAGGAVASAVAWKRGPAVPFGSLKMLATIAAAAFCLGGATIAGAQTGMGSVLLVVCEVGLLVATAQIAMTNQTTLLAAITLVPATEALESMVLGTMPAGFAYAAMFVLATIGFLLLARRRMRRIRAKLEP